MQYSTHWGLVLAVTLISFGSVFFFFLRMDRLTRRLEDEVKALEEGKEPEEVEAAPLAKP